MTSLKYIVRSLIYYRRSNSAVILGVALCSAALVGALGVGDSVRHSLKRISLGRLGKVSFAMDSGSRLIGKNLADRLEKRIDANVASVLMSRGTLIVPSGQQQINDINILGIDTGFWRFANKFPSILPEDDLILINRKTAERLGVGKGDRLILRVSKLDPVSFENPFSAASDIMVGFPVRIAGVVDEENLGGFGLYPDQVMPHNVFMASDYLNRMLGYKDKANLMLVNDLEKHGDGVSRLQTELDAVLSLEDAGLLLELDENAGSIFLKSESIFLPEPVIDAALGANTNAQGIFSYFLNSIESATGTVPYSFAVAPGDKFLPPGIENDGVLVNQWTANDLDIDVSDQITLRYYILKAGNKLVETQRVFRVYGIVPVIGDLADKTPDPGFPGLAGVENCSEWKPGVPINFDRIRDKDEDYWDRHGATPKVFCAMSEAKEMWSNRFGSLTAVRYQLTSHDSVRKNILTELEPQDIGLRFIPVRQEALRASNESVDFGQLFLGLSFFIIAAALMLTGLLFVFAIKQREQETGVLLALGFEPRYIRKLLIAECALITFAGICMGAVLGVAYTNGILIALATFWQETVRTSRLVVKVSPFSIIAGAAGAGLMAFIILFIVTIRKAGTRVSRFLAERGGLSVPIVAKRSITWRIVLLLLGVAGVFFLFFLPAGRNRAGAVIFFLAGSLTLTFFWLAFDLCLVVAGSKDTFHYVGIFSAALRSAALNRTRSLAAMAIFSCGVFLVVAISANRKNITPASAPASSGTGGFELIGETSVPIQWDLRTDSGQRKAGLDPAKLDGVDFLPMRIRDGAQANCLNLNRIEQPRLLGVDPVLLAEKNAFSFTATQHKNSDNKKWDILSCTNPDDIVPGVADQTVIVWGLGKKTGDFITYTDSGGKQFNIRLAGALANSIFQGNLIISESQMLKAFPDISGYRFFLVDAPHNRTDEVQRYLNKRLADWGADFVSAREKLAEFNQVENTYLDIFLMLGGIGLLLGTCGFGIVVLRNIIERKNQLSVLRAIGYTKRLLRAMLICEHALLVACGLIAGAVSALIAVAPTLATANAAIPGFELIATVILIMFSSIFWVWASALFATRSNLLESLRRE